MRLLSRYIAREYLTNLAFGVAVFTFILLLDKLFEIIDLLLHKGAGLWLTTKLFLMLLPSFLTLTLPMAHLLSSLLTFGHLSETNEITAMRASGLNLHTIASLPLWAAILTSLFLVPLNTLWAPRTVAGFRSLYAQILQRNPLVRIQEKTFIEIGQYHLYVEEVKRKSGKLVGVSIYKTPPDKPPLRIVAREGLAQVNPSIGMTLFLRQGSIQQVDPTLPEKIAHSAFETYVLTIPVEGEKSAMSRTLKEMDSFELKAQQDRYRASGLPVPAFETEWHTRFALAATPFLFALLGIPLAIQVERGGKSQGFGISLVILFIYYILLMVSLTLAERGKVPAGLTVWMPNGVCGILGTWLFGRVKQR